MLVGRERLLEEIYAAFHKTGPPSEQATMGRFDLPGRPGSGKTAIVGELEADREDNRDFVPIRVNLEDFSTGLKGDAGETASVGAVQASFQQFRDLLLVLAAAFGDDVADALQRVVTAAFNSEVATRRIFSLEQAMRELSPAEATLEPVELAKAWQEAASRVKDGFLALWNAAAEERWEADHKCQLILLDNLDEIAGEDVGTWLLALLPQLERTAVVVTRQPEAVELLPETVGPFAVLPVQNLDKDQMLEYLTDDGARDISSEIATTVHTITLGHPGMVSVIRELLWGSAVGAHRDVESGHTDDELRDLLHSVRDLSSDDSAKVALLVERMMAKRFEQSVSSALWAAAVPRRFDVKLLTALLAADGSEGDVSKRAREVFDAFGHLSFVEDVTLPKEAPHLRIRSYVRDGLLDRMRGEARFDTLHAAAAKYHNDSLRSEGASDTSFTYTEAFVYEDPEWQRHKREWLYHAGQAPTGEFIVEAARVFLEAFWWWGTYVHFDFCDQLIADLHHIESGNATLDDLRGALQSFLTNYPCRSHQSGGKEAWEKVFDALLAIQTACGMGHSRKPHTPRETKVAALLDVFKAHKFRFADHDDELALACYERAADGFGGGWNTAWVRFEQAELCAAQVSVNEDALRGYWQQAADVAQPQGDEPDEFDEELTAGLHRLRADVWWRNGDYARAASWYRRAVLHAYLFHDVGTPPDEYTLQFYVDIRARVINRLLERWQAGDDVTAISCARELAYVRTVTSPEDHAPSPDVLAKLLPDGAKNPQPLADALFPEGPEVGDLGTSSVESAFIRTLRRRRERLLNGPAGGAIQSDLRDGSDDIAEQRWPGAP